MGEQGAPWEKQPKEPTHSAAWARPLRTPLPRPHQRHLPVARTASPFCNDHSVCFYSQKNVPSKGTMPLWNFLLP